MLLGLIITHAYVVYWGWLGTEKLKHVDLIYVIFFELCEGIKNSDLSHFYWLPWQTFTMPSGAAAKIIRVQDAPAPSSLQPQTRTTTLTEAMKNSWKKNARENANIVQQHLTIRLVSYPLLLMVYHSWKDFPITIQNLLILKAIREYRHAHAHA